MKRIAALIALAATTILGGGSAQATYPGPNGRIAFADYVSGQIYAVNPDGTGLAQLTHTGSSRVAGDPSWSPSGKRVLFEVFRIDKPNDRSRIWIMHADGSHRHRLGAERKGFRDFNPQFTPDAQKIVFSRCQSPEKEVCAIWKMRADGTHRHPLTPYRGQKLGGNNSEVIDVSPSVAPNGRRIAFTRFQGLNGIEAQIYLMRADGSHLHPVTPAWIEAGTSDWSPNGRWIVFESNAVRIGSSIFRMKPDGTRIHRITPSRYPHNDALPSYSPEGDRITFVSDRNHADICCNDLFAVDAIGGGESLIDIGLSDIGILSPAWGTAPLTP
jgi:Tol biopolymer transport system component